MTVPDRVPSSFRPGPRLAERVLTALMVGCLLAAILIVGLGMA